MANRLYGALLRTEVLETVQELLINPDKKSLIYVVDDISNRINPYRDGFAINRGRTPLEAFVADPAHNRYFVIREKDVNLLVRTVRNIFGLGAKTGFVLEETSSFCMGATDEFDKFENIYLYEGTLDQMIEEFRYSK